MSVILSDATHSEDSDCCNSEIEFQLYSQLHYHTVDHTCAVNKQSSRNISCYSDSVKLKEPVVISNAENNFPACKRKRTISDCSNDVEDWEIIKSDNSSDSSDSDIWQVSQDDIHRSDKRILRYYNQTQIVCSYCSKEGHKVFKCPYKARKKLCCYLCGAHNHLYFQCDLDRQLDSCYDQRYKCKRCRQVGHPKEECPDLWRQFHSTVNTKRLIIPEQAQVPKHKRMCHCCCKSGHWAHECDKAQYSDAACINPTVSSYRLNGKIKRKNSDFFSKPKIFNKFKKKSQSDNCKDPIAGNSIFSDDNFQSFEINKFPSSNSNVQEDCVFNPKDSTKSLGKKRQTILSDGKVKKNNHSFHPNKKFKSDKQLKFEHLRDCKFNDYRVKNFEGNSLPKDAQTYSKFAVKAGSSLQNNRTQIRSSNDVTESNAVVKFNNGFLSDAIANGADTISNTNINSKPAVKVKSARGFFRRINKFTFNEKKPSDATGAASNIIKKVVSKKRRRKKKKFDSSSCSVTLQ